MAGEIQMRDIHSKIQVVSSAAAPTLDIFGAALSVLSDGSGMPWAVGEQTVPPGYGVPPHVHTADDEMFYILEGELVVGGTDGEAKVRAGSVVQLPRGVPHGFRNDTQMPARMLVISSPGIQALEMFRHFDRAGRGGELTPKEIGSIAAQYGVRFV
jgi:quercetin dioxygenase-like cupin family protein